jgi:hypothetical protein
MPGVLAPVVDAMSSFPAPWALCGGWAVDAWLGRVSREHGDIDISVFARDQRALLDHLRGWQLVAHDVSEPASSAYWTGRWLDPPAHLHGRIERDGPAPSDGICTVEDGYILDAQIDDIEGEQWILRRDPLISMPIERAYAASPWGVSAVTPEVLLFLKSNDPRRRDKLDFERLLPHVSAGGRGWLRDAIARAGHPWMAALSSGDA